MESNEYLLNTFTISQDILEGLAELLSVKNSKDCDVRDEANQWFLNNFQEKRLVGARGFYNQTINRKEIHISYESDLVANI